MRRSGNHVLVTNFLDNFDRDSRWSLRLARGRDPDSLVLSLHWAGREAATHRARISLRELIAMLVEAPQLSSDRPEMDEGEENLDETGDPGDDHQADTACGVSCQRDRGRSREEERVMKIVMRPRSKACC